MANLVAGNLKELQADLAQYKSIVNEFSSQKGAYFEQTRKALLDLADILEAKEQAFFQQELGWDCSPSEGLALMRERAEDFNRNAGTLAMVNDTSTGFRDLTAGILNGNAATGYDYDIQDWVDLELTSGNNEFSAQLGQKLQDTIVEALRSNQYSGSDLTSRNFDVNYNAEYGMTKAGDLLIQLMETTKKTVSNTAKQAITNNSGKAVADALRRIKLSTQRKLTDVGSKQTSKELQAIYDELYPISSHLGWIVDDMRVVERSDGSFGVQLKLNGYIPKNSSAMNVLTSMGVGIKGQARDTSMDPRERLIARLREKILNGVNGSAIWPFVEVEIRKDKSSYAWSDKNIQVLKGFLGEVRANAMLNYAIHNGRPELANQPISLPAGTMTGTSSVYKDKSIPTDVFVKATGFQVKNYAVGGNNIYKFTDENTIPYVLEHKMNMPSNIRDVVNTFFADYSFNQEAEHANADYQATAKEFEPYKRDFDYIGRAYIPYMMSIEKEYGMNVQDNPYLKAAGFENENMKYNTFFIINKYIIAASSMVRALAESIDSDSFDATFNISTTKEVAFELQTRVSALVKASKKTEDFNASDSKKLAEKQKELAKVEKSLMTYDIWKKSAMTEPPEVLNVLAGSNFFYRISVHLDNFIGKAMREGAQI